MLRNTSLNSSYLLWSLALILLPTTMILSLSNNTTMIEISFNFISSTKFSLPILLDFKGVLFSSVVLLISANVLKFSNSYMSDETFKKRFTYLILLFVLSMNLLIYIPNMMALLLGWDGLGIVSFILVIHYQSPKALASGMITALSNRIGDAMIILSISWALTQGHWSVLNMWSSPLSSTISITIMLAAITKSAQIPFSSWLPAAMAAPTPVSALVHSSTLVTAGVYLLLRFYPFLKLSQTFHFFMMIIAMSTMLMAGMAAIAETDMKKIIALSTLSQLGVMMSSIAMMLPNLAFFHLITHALFKALLFISAGTLISLHNHSQDLRQMGNLTKQMPLSMSCMLTANLALCGFPFLAGFYSKDMILESFTFLPNMNFFIMNVLFLATMFTSAYTSRLMMTTIISQNMSIPINMTNDLNKNNTTPMIVLTTGAITGGAMTNWLLPITNHDPMISPFYKSLPIISTLTGAWLAMSMSSNKQPSFLSIPFTHFFLQSMWLHTPISTQMIMKPPLNLSSRLLKISDQGWMEMFSSQGINSSLFKSSKTLQLAQANLVTTHLTITMMIFLPILTFY